MKIRRGAKKGIGLLDLTDQKELQAGEWKQQQRIVFDINKGLLPVRGSVVEVEITENDVDTLYRGLEEARRRELVLLREQVRCYEDTMYDIKRLAVLQRVAPKNDFHERVEDLLQTALDKF